MSDDLCSTLLSAIGIAAFERGPEGDFRAVVPPPHWFAGLVADGTFPFLGHVLEEAVAFWNAGEDGSRQWGPCAEIDESGREFHFDVTAVTVRQKQYLLVQLDAGTDRVRDVLQVVRQRTLDDDTRARRQMSEAMGTLNEVHRLLGQLLASGPTAAQLELLRQLAARCDELVQHLSVREPRKGASPRN